MTQNWRWYLQKTNLISISPRRLLMHTHKFHGEIRKIFIWILFVQNILHAKSEGPWSHCLLFSKVSLQLPYEPAYDKTYNKTCGTRKDSDQPVHLHSLIRVFSDRMCLLKPDYLKRDKRESFTYWVDVQPATVFGQSQAKKCLRTCTKCEDSDHPAYVLPLQTV